MTFGQFLGKQFIAVIEWNEPADGILSYRYPMRDLEIENGGKLTVSESQMAVFVNEGKVADVFGPGLHTLNTRNLPLLTDLMNWNKAFESPFKSEVYFFSTRLQIDQKWGTATPITIRDKEFGAVRLRCYGIYSYRIADPRIFFNQISGTRDSYLAADLEGQLRDTIVGGMTQIFANSDLSFLDMAANHSVLAEKIAEQMRPTFAALGLALDKFVVENVSLPEELQKVFDQRIGMNMVGDLGRYTLYAAAESLDLSAANTSGAAGMGMGLGAGAAVAQVLSNALKPSISAPGGIPSQGPTPAPILIGAPAGSEAAGAEAVKFCIECGKPIPQRAKYCAECGKAQ
ncbi:MAG: SPFH domain-containing protein [Terracidiphilus sp.]|jgi:membrane protease subunit (stomatin/prohibitin family)